MLVREISEHEFSEFIEKINDSNPNQSIGRGRVYKLQHQEFAYYGLVDDEKIVIAGLFLFNQAFKFFKEATCFKGPLGAVEDVTLMSHFVKGLNIIFNEKRVISYRMSPDIELVERDLDGEIVEGGYDHRTIVAEFSEIGINHQGYYNGYVTDAMRWYFIKDISLCESKEALFNSFDKRTKRTIKQAKKNGVMIRELRRDELDIAYDLLLEVATRENFTLREKDYFYTLYDGHIKDESIIFPVAVLNIEAYKKQVIDNHHEIIEQIKTLNNRILENPDSKKSINLLKQQQQALQASQRRIDDFGLMESKAIDGNFYMATGVFFKNQNTMSYFNGGSSHEFLNIGGATLLQFEMMEYARSLGLDYYDFFGTGGPYSGSDDCSIYEFKRGFGGKVVEYAGSFEVVLKSWIHSLRQH